MPDISDEEFKELQTLRSQSVTKDLEVARANFRAENPHVPAGLVNSWSGDPTQFGDYGKVLLEQFPKPQAPVAPAATPPPAAPATPPAPPIPAAPPPAAVPPIMAAPMPTPPSPEAARLAYQQGLVNGNPVLPGAVPPAPAAPPAPAPIPMPGSTDQLAQKNAIAAESQRIRDLMTIGRATPEQVQWLAQYGEKGFVAAMTTHAARVRAVVGRS